MFSIGVVTRIFKGEIPYINNFLDYYINYLNVDCIYLFSNDDTVWSKYIDNSFLEKIKIDYCPAEFLNTPNMPRNMELLDYMNKYYIDVIQEDYLLNVDCDEYLFLNNSSFNDFIDKYTKYDNIYINWVFFPSNTFDNNTPVDIIMQTKGIRNPVGKSLSKRKSIINIYDTANRTMHVPLLKEGGITLKLKSSDYYLMHFVSRTLNDLLIQELFWSGNFKLNEFINKKYNNKNNFNLYPARFKVHKVFMDFNKHFNKNPIAPPSFNNFNFSFHYVHLFETELLNTLIQLTPENEENLLFNLELDFLHNSVYVDNIKAVETISKNYYKRTNFNKILPKIL